MAKPQEKVMIKKQDLNEIAVGWVDIGDKMDDDSEHAKSKNMLHDDQVALAKTAEKENTSELIIMTRYVNVQEAMVKFLEGEDIVIDLQLASGAMIQVTKALDEDVKAEYRQVRVIGKADNIDKAEKLIKAFIALVDVGGASLLFEDYGDSDGHGTKYDRGKLPVQRFGHGQRCSRFLKRPYGRRLSCRPIRRFGNGQSHYRSRSLYGKRPYVSGFDVDSDTDSYSSEEYDSDESYRRSKRPYGWRHPRSGTNSYSSDYNSNLGYRGYRSRSLTRSPSLSGTNSHSSDCKSNHGYRGSRSPSRSRSLSRSPSSLSGTNSHSSDCKSNHGYRGSRSPSRSRSLSRSPSQSSCSLSPKRPYGQRRG